MKSKKSTKTWKNKLYFGDNLDILRDKIPDNFVDLIYLDPPFKSGKNYNIIFNPEADGYKGATAQIQTFEDTWSWGEEAEKNYEGLISGEMVKEKPNQKLIDWMKTTRTYLGECSMMAYLSMMAPRLLEMRRVLKDDTGSIYLHCDPTASHYLKLLMDAIFDGKNFQNEIIWCYEDVGGRATKYFKRKHDVILFYQKSKKRTLFNIQHKPLSASTLKRFEKYFDKDGRITYKHLKDTNPGVFKKLKGIPENLNEVWLDKNKGQPLSDWWTGISPIKRGFAEYLYPTQKPEKLLKRIIMASSNRGDVVLDPFCGCGTTIAVAQGNHRKWIGIDITYLAVDVILKRLIRNGIKENKDFEIKGSPKDTYSAHKLFERNKIQFEIWCVTKLNANPSERKTGDKGVDGIINFPDPSKKSKIGKGIIQVKGGENISPSMVRELKGTLVGQNADFGILITSKKLTPGMIAEATKSGWFEILGKKFPKIQFLTVEDLFKEPIPVKLPSVVLPPYKNTVISEEVEDNQNTIF